MVARLAVLKMVLSLAALNAFAQTSVSDFRVVQEEDSYYAVSDQVKFPLAAQAGPPTLRRIEDAPQHPGLKMLVYSSGEVGTTQFYDIERAIVFAPGKSKVLVDLPIRYIPKGNARAVLQPEWIWQKDTLKVLDQEDRGARVVSLK